jgi:NAD(P)H-flavin reductase
MCCLWPPARQIEAFMPIIPWMDKNEDPAGNPKRTIVCECIHFAYASGDTASLEFIWPGPAPKGGQFFLVKPRRTGVFLARPISAAGYKPRTQKYSEKQPISVDGFDRRLSIDRRTFRHQSSNFERRDDDERRASSAGTLRFLVARRGQGTRDIVEMRPGEEAELTGPLGNSWPFLDIPVDPVKGKSASPVALIGGGVGIAPLLALAQELGKRPFDFYAGFRTLSFGLENIKPRALIVATESGSQGVKGKITDFFTPTGYYGAFACGPEPMLKLVGDACIAHGIPCFISTEKHMACGVGACLGCKIKTTRGSRCCCCDGPIFNAEEICFEN